MMIIYRVLSFLQEIGLGVELQNGANGFLPHIRISHGRMLVDPLCFVGDLLHEAGHLATIPSCWRVYADHDFSKVQERMFDDLRKMRVHPDSPIYRAAMSTSDPEATAWAWAAGKHLGLDEKNIIAVDDDHYDGDGKDIRLMLSMRRYLGINGLAYAGFCSVNNLCVGGLPTYPKLEFWTQEVDLPSLKNKVQDECKSS